MKSQTDFISVDDFKLQLSEIMESQKELRKEVVKKDEFILYKLHPFPMSISSATSWFYFLIQLFWLVHFIFCYIKCFSGTYGIDSIFVTIYDVIKQYSSIGLVINSTLIILIFFSIIFPKMEKDAGALFIFEYLGSQVYPYLRYLIELSLYSTAFFLFDISIINWVIFIFSVSAALISTTLLQNFTLRKDEFCCKSIHYSVLWRSSLIVSLIIGVIGANGVSNSGGLILWALSQMIIGVVLLICYYNFGIYIYRHKVPRYLFFFIIVGFTSLATAAFFDSLEADKYKKTNFILLGPLFLVVMIFLNWSSLERRRRIGAQPDNKSIKEKSYFLFNKFQNCDNDQEDDCQLRGIFYYHNVSGCENPKCVVNLKQVYDSKKKKYCSITKIGQNRVSLVKFYIKCLYEEALLQDPENIELRLDYIEFYYLKLKNLYSVLLEIQQLERRLLGPFQRLRLVRLKKIIKEQCNGFSEDLFLRNLSMERTLEAQQNFTNIQKKIEIVVSRNQLFWRYVQRNEVFLTDMLNTIKPNFSLVDDLSDQWSQVSDYFNINRRWKFYYLCFTLFIKNQKLKPNQVQDFGNSVEYDSIFKTGNYFIDKTTEKEALYNPIMLFQQNTCFVSVTCDQQKMLIKRVSGYFKRNFDYQPRDMINSPLYNLMPPSIRSFHHAIFLSWVKDGRTNNQECYHVKKIMPLTGLGYLAPSFKFYKYYLRSDSEIEYIAMLKRNRKDEMLILANDKFEIEAITQGLAQKLKIQDSEYHFFQGLPLLSLIPMLAKYTSYSQFIKQKDQDFLQNDDNQIYFKKQSTYLKGGSQSDANILSQRKVLNLTNLKLLIPLNMKEEHHELKLMRREKKENQFQIIREFYESLRRTRQYSKFKIEMYIYQRNYQPFTDKKFYQLQINQLQQNNRLDKIKDEDQLSQSKSDAVSSMKSVDGGALQIDINNFFQLNKKRNKVVLVPSNNIFLKDENNQALSEIKHISSINISIRIIVIVFAIILMIVLIIELLMGAEFSQVNNQYFLVNRQEKMNWLINTQYNMQHMQLGNQQQTVFVINVSSKKMTQTMSEVLFQKTLFDEAINIEKQFLPYFPNPYPFWTNQVLINPPLGHIAVFNKLREHQVALNFRATDNMNDPLQRKSYHVINAYLYGVFQQTQLMKTNLIDRYNQKSKTLSTFIISIGISFAILIVLCFLFVLTRYFKVTYGFSQLLSIFIQMDNMDIRKILKFTDYTKNLFMHLRFKYERMGESADASRASSSYYDLQKPSSSEHGGEEIMTSTTNANLNKKLKKIELGEEIKDIQCKAAGLTIAFLILLGISLLIPIVYSSTSLKKLNQLQDLGFTILRNSSLPYAIINGIFQKYRNANLYTFQKYSDILTQFSSFIKSSQPLEISSKESEVAKLFRDIYFEDFCTKKTEILENTLKAWISKICDLKFCNVTICNYVRQHFTYKYLLGQCKIVQNQQLPKGGLSFFTYLINKYGLFFKNALAPTSKDMTQLNDALFIIFIYESQMTDLWLSQSEQFIQNRILMVTVTTIAAFCLIIALHIIFVQYLISNTLNTNYEMFRRMHQNLIPEFVINKEKIIKAKLIKEGFMKQ